ncbi:hypothetical protein G4B88_011121 [Cannabis sativa]|uniref:DUF4283 domain-containing protein n=1 Tax=Cannabis sativa TaxID=3483 RepID=A0A7J6HJK4_CANSA|nr:hypothetical protein G4B88_011121 [Cannabis sativa]
MPTQDYAVQTGSHPTIATSLVPPITVSEKQVAATSSTNISVAITTCFPMSKTRVCPIDISTTASEAAHVQVADRTFDLAKSSSNTIARVHKRGRQNKCIGILGLIIPGINQMDGAKFHFIFFYRDMADTTLNELFEESVQVSVEDITCDLHPGEVDPPNEPCKVILGKLFCHTRLGRKAIQGSLNNAWASISGWSWKEREDGLLQFSFRTSFDAENVLLRRPWLVCGYLLVLMPWPSWLTPEEVKFDHTPIWIRLKSIPPLYWNKTNLQEMAGKVSTVYELPRHIEKNFERGSFGMGTLRFRATVELSKPLFSGFFLRRTGIKDLWLQYQYEKLPRICYKCGLMTHEHKFCFKTPAVIKNTKGEFFPMFGNWMAEDAIERSPFTLPLPKWFSEWIVNQKAAKDEKMRQLLKNQRLSLQIEWADSRELRTQYPGKRRQVETVVETRVSSGELVINRYPAVTLLGIGEVTPFENTANLIVEKILPDLPPLEVIRTMQKKKDVASCSGTKLVSAKVGTRHAIPHSPSDHQVAEVLGDATGEESIIEAPNFLVVGI